MCRIDASGGGRCARRDAGKQGIIDIRHCGKGCDHCREAYASLVRAIAPKILAGSAAIAARGCWLSAMWLWLGFIR